MEKDRPIYLISAVAKMFEVHAQTLRLYEREGLLLPSRTDGNTRLYSEQDLERLDQILTLSRDMGVNLAGIELILKLKEQIRTLEYDIQGFVQALTAALDAQHSEAAALTRELAQRYPWNLPVSFYQDSDNGDQDSGS